MGGRIGMYQETIEVFMGWEEAWRSLSRRVVVSMWMLCGTSGRRSGEVANKGIGRKKMTEVRGIVDSGD